ncbi:hypothetical protein BVRB_8g188070 [Beta vulgaris subsp. vulgaris]|uniref:Uncharacterized protein n=1 Tax=Beta vulgaris subsp. vulgaris TaxID=3555 RepID=A0A0J8BQT7_BETVV|nr:hypothetical protein BVRB_8g188070 [Beta vulgaris subsp. vulgaris]
MANNKINLIILIFFCASIFFSLAVPSSRSLIMNQNKLKSSSSRVLLTQTAAKVGIDYGWTKETGKTKASKGRMDIELNDYPGTGANNNHEPKPGNGA